MKNPSSVRPFFLLTALVLLVGCATPPLVVPAAIAAKDRVTAKAVTPAQRAQSQPQAEPLTLIDALVMGIMGLKASSSPGPDYLSQLDSAVRRLSNEIERTKDEGAKQALWPYVLRGRLLERQLSEHKDRTGLLSRPLALAALADYDYVLANESRLRPSADPGKFEGELLSFDLPGVLLSATVVAKNYLGDVPRSYGYLEQCAKRNDLDCMGYIGLTSHFGFMGQPIDLPKAMSLYLAVVRANDFEACGGALSASGLWMLNLLDNVATPEGNAEYWSKKSFELAKVASDSRGKPACGMYNRQARGYLFAKSDSDKVASSFVPYAGKFGTSPRENGDWAIGALLAGKLSLSRFDDILSKEDAGTRCELWVTASWYFRLKGDVREAERYLAALNAERDEECKPEQRLGVYVSQLKMR
jgi:hypothetical protein